jgi:hypothetical protein
MPQRQTIQRARRQKRRGKAATTQAGEFVGSRRTSGSRASGRTVRAKRRRR